MHLDIKRGDLGVSSGSKAGKVVISAEDIERFCELTGDPNPLHQKDFMQGLGLEPLLPGMLAADIGIIVDGQFDLYSSSNFYFSPTFPGKLTISTDYDGLTTILHAEASNGTDALASNGHNTRLTWDEMPDEVSGEARVIPYNEAKVYAFADIFGPSVEEKEARRLYVINGVSPALFDIPVNPANEVEEAIATKMAKGYHPVYSHMRVFSGNGELPLESEIAFVISAQPAKPERPLDKNTAFSFGIDIHVDGDRVYHAQTALGLIPERMLARALTN